VTSAAIYARVSSARQKKDETIGSQTAALRDHARQLGAELPEEWVFEDEGHSGATLVRPALERLRDVVAGVGVDVVLCYSPDRLARKFAYQALLIEEFARAGTRVEFIKGPRGDSPEDQLMVQFQGMFAEYEKAQLMERYRRGKAYRAKAGSVNVLGGAPFGYRYLSKSPGCGAGYEIAEHEAALVAEMFRRYADDGASIADLARWLTSENVPTRTGKSRWDRSVIWGMLRNPAYAGTAVFGKTMVVQESPGLNRRARLEGRTTPRSSKTVDRPRGEWIEIPVPAIVTAETFERAARRLEDNKRFASRNSKIPSLLQGLAACSACGYGYYRTSTRTTNKKIYYYRCLGSDDYRYQGGRVCGNKPVRADYLDTVVWDHITHLLADPALIRAEISKRLEQARTADPATRQRKRLELALAKATTAITRMIEAFQEQLITIDELRARMPDLRARETNLRGQLDALDTQLADQEAYLKLADDLEGFLTQLRASTSGASVPERQRVLRLLVKDVLVGPEKITIRHRIPIRERTSHSNHEHQTPDTEGDQSASCPLRWGRVHAVDVQRGPVGAGRVHRPGARRARNRHDGASQAPSARRAELQARPVRRRLVPDGLGLQGRRAGSPRGDRRGFVHDGLAPAAREDPDHPHRRRPGLPRMAHPAPPQTRKQPAVRLHLPIAQSSQGRNGQGQDHLLDDGHQPAARRPPAPAQPGAPGLVRLLPPRSVHRRLQLQGYYAWQQVGRWLCRKHHRSAWKDLRRLYYKGDAWWPASEDRQLFNPAKTGTTRYRYRGTAIPAPWPSTG
jgi:site-specific DNA recombinase